MRRPLVILTSAIAGLGHLRVTRALEDALPPSATHIFLPAGDTWLTHFHNVMSNHAPLRHAFESIQDTPFLEDWFTWLARVGVHLSSAKVIRQIVAAVKQAGGSPTEIIIACSHFMLAEAVGYRKLELEAALNLPVRLAVQVTDDTTQHIWCVPGTDLLITPSSHSARGLATYLENHHLPSIPMIILPYPIAPLFGEVLAGHSFAHRLSQYRGTLPVEVVIPISGAAVGLPFLTSLASSLSRSTQPVFHLHLVGENSPRLQRGTEALTHLRGMSFIKASSDNATISAYNRLYRQHVIGLEITKPSEQSFKVLAGRGQVGGSILFFTSPVGRQEYENLAYLVRNRFIPSPRDRNTLFSLARYHAAIPAEMLAQAKFWRGIQLPPDPVTASAFIAWCVTSGLCLKMGTVARREPSLQPTGAREFWDVVLKY